jgi:hypothetical protein
MTTLTNSTYLRHLHDRYAALEIGYDEAIRLGQEAGYNPAQVDRALFGPSKGGPFNEVESTKRIMK